jgi:signal transduction histidine kinase
MTTGALGRLLIVDDESELVAALCRILKAERYATTGVASGEEALTVLRNAAAGGTTGFDVLITDLKMPVMDGISVLRAAQEIDRNLVSIVMTGHGTIDSAVEAMKGGALDYLLKPFNLSVMRPVLSRALTVRRLRVENAELIERLEKRTAELEAANNELETFTHSVSHDLRQPLSGVMGFAEFLLSEKAGPLNAKQKEYLRDIHNGGRHLLSLTADLLRFSRAGQQALTKETVNIANTVWGIGRAMQKAEPGRNVELRVGPLPDALADPTLLEQVFFNLLSNAFKFTRREPNPVIEISGQQTASERTYCVRDNGTGFDMAKAQRLFSMFQRFHRDGDFEGTGLGLSIVQRIIERHGGRISAQSAVGQGATFTITLPA